MIIESALFLVEVIHSRKLSCIKLVLHYKSMLGKDSKLTNFTKAVR